MAREFHKLFEQGPDEKDEEVPEWEEIGVMNVCRLIGTRKIPDTRAYRPDEIPDLDAAAKLFGSGDYQFIGRRLNEGPDGQPAGSIWRKRIHTIGSEHGPWLRMLDKPPVPQPNGAPVNGAPVNGVAMAPAAPLPGMPPPGTESNPMMMMMWMMMQQGQRDAEARREQNERDRISAERHEQEARRQHELTIEMIRQSSKGNDSNGVPSIVASVADTFAKIHAPPPPPAPVVAAATPAPTLKQQLEDAIAIKDFAKKMGGDDDIELVKAIGQGLGSLSGLGSLIGGLSGAPAPGS